MPVLTEMFFSDGEIDTTIHWNGVLTTAYVTHRDFGITARGHALHNSEDIYNPEIGQTIAVSRAMSRMYKKIERETIRATK
jgi:Domain of unknown function (DUF1876)